MKKIFKIYNAVSTDVNLEDKIEVSNIDEVYEIIRGCWGVQSFQVKFKYNEYSKFYEIVLITCNSALRLFLRSAGQSGSGLPTFRLFQSTFWTGPHF